MVAGTQDAAHGDTALVWPGPLPFDIMPGYQADGRSIYVANRDPLGQQVTVEVQGSGEGDRRYNLTNPGDWIMVPAGDINLVRVSAQAYPVTFAFAILSPRMTAGQFTIAGSGTAGAVVVSATTRSGADLANSNLKSLDPTALVPLAVLDYGEGSGTQLWRLRTPDVFKPQNGVAINPEATIWTPAAGKKFRLMGGVVSASVAGGVVLRDNTAGTIIAVIPTTVIAQPVPFVLGNGILSAAANNVLTATGAAAATLTGTVFGTEE